MPANLPKVYKEPVFPQDNLNYESLLKYATLYTLYNITRFNANNPFRNYNSLAKFIFSKRPQDSMEYLLTITDYYNEYFETNPDGVLQIRLNLDELIQDYPEWFDHKQIHNRQRSFTEIKEGSLRALMDERRAAIREKIKNTYRVKDARLLPEVNNGYLYELQLDVENDDYIKVYEGIEVSWIINNAENSVTTLSYDSMTSVLSISAQQKFEMQSAFKNSSIRIDAVWLIDQLTRRLGDLYEVVDMPLSDLIRMDMHGLAGHQSQAVQYGKTDQSQRDAIDHCLNQNITMLWGPPGTGKSYTLGRIISNLLSLNERTLVCCTSNVAVDIITLAALEAIAECTPNQSRYLTNGSILRVGYTRDPSILDKENLFPSSPQIMNLRSEIQELYQELSNLSDSEKTNTMAAIVNRKNSLSDLIRQRILSANTVFATASFVHVDTSIQDVTYDNIVIDEGSMMSTPHFLPIAIKASKRIIITGDFRQLGPVALSTTRFARQWLHKDLFEFAGIDYRHGKYESVYLRQLLNQRRSHSAICGITNELLYNNRLHTLEGEHQNLLRDDFPCPGRSIAYFELGENNGYRCERTKRGSRKNEKAAEFIWTNIIQQLIHHPKLTKIETIGIISPYRAQIGLHTSNINNGRLSETFKEKLKLGTIHSFQGSEADLIVLDLVDSSAESLGKLYQFEEGTRLLNVAISRARSKLVIVGNIPSILLTKGNRKLSRESRKILERLKREKIDG